MKTMRHSRQSLDKPSGLAFTFPGKRSFLSFLRKVSLFLLFSFFAFSSFSNNIRIEGVVSVSESSHSDTLLLSFSLRWDHSWRDEFNWDAAWVFLKYKTASGAWQPVYLSPGGHRFTDASGSALPFGSMEGETDGKTVGVFIYRTALESGNTPEIRCHLLCPRSSLGGLPAEAFQRNEAFLLAQGIEMVYIPYGAYYAGDSSSFHTIADAGGHPILVDSEESVFLSAGGSSYTLSSSYPKGYKGFYVMKYEVSQEQYVTFLNNLTYTQQQERVPGLASFSKGDYIFGDASQPSCRNGIIVAVPSEGGRAVIFANNLNNDAKYSQSDDGKTLACNYLSPEDMIAYLSWSGLRPMSELEYEKACRAPYPEMPLEKEYAWHENSGVNALGSVVSSGERTEKSGTVGANVNAGNRFSGPVRCGLFATGSSSQRDAGASFWGVMEMSGNLRELCYNVSAANAFSGDVYGDGTYNKSRWSTVVSHFGVRGGGFSSVDSLLRVSDRSEAESYFASLTQRDSTVGFRGVRGVKDIRVEAGSLVVKGDGTAVNYACPGNLVSITSQTKASADIANVGFSYLWYMKIDNSDWKLIPEETGETLNYDTFINTTSSNILYKFKRKAICAVGSASSTEYVLTVPNPGFDITPASTYLDGANAAGSVITATALQNGGLFQWFYGTVSINDSENITTTNSPYSSIYRPSHNHYGGASGTVFVICQYEIGGCLTAKNIPIETSPYNTNPCQGQTSVTDAEGNIYNITAIGSQCWMQQNLNIGTMRTYSTSNHFSFDEPGIQRTCSKNDINNCNQYGGLYEWWEVVCNGYCSSLPVSKFNLEIHQGNYASAEEAAKAAVPDIKMTPDGKKIQGICPDGWHLPTDEEWKQLEIYLGMSRQTADMETSSLYVRATDNEGTKLKAASPIWDGSSTLTNPDDKLRFYGLPGGNRDYNQWSSFLVSNYFLTSTPIGIYSYYRSMTKGDPTIRRPAWEREQMQSVRCIKNN